MKEMCRNFICNNKQCPQANTNMTTPSFTQAEANIPFIQEIPMADCSNCVMNRIGLAQAYVPSQPYTSPMTQEQSLICGTVFSDLAMPYCSGWNIYRFGKEASV